MCFFFQIDSPSDFRHMKWLNHTYTPFHSICSEVPHFKQLLSYANSSLFGQKSLCKPTAEQWLVKNSLLSESTVLFSMPNPGSKIVHYVILEKIQLYFLQLLTVFWQFWSTQINLKVAILKLRSSLKCYINSAIEYSFSGGWKAFCRTQTWEIQGPVYTSFLISCFLGVNSHEPQA